MTRRLFDILSSTVALLFIVNDVTAGVKWTKTVKIKSGLEDATAIVGQLFNYTISSDAFVGKVVFYQVLEAGMDELPSWLLWDNRTLSLYGVPDEEDLGPHYISVTAVGAPVNDTHTSLAKDVFTIEVCHDGSRQAKLAQQSSESKEDGTEECNDDRTVASILLNVSLATLKPKQRIVILQRVSELFKFPVFRLRLLNLDYFETTFRQSETFASTLLEDQQQQHLETKNRKNALLLFVLGCSSQDGASVPSYEASLVDQLRSSIAQNTFSTVLGFADSIDLHIASGKFSPKKRRRHARQLNPSSYGRTTAETDTPPQPTRPTVVTVVRISPTMTTTPTTTVYRPLYPPTTTSRPTYTASRRPTSRRTTTTAATTTEKITSTRLEPSSTTLSTTARATTTKSTTIAPTTVISTTLPPTKKPGDGRPELVTSLGSLTCYKGVLCEYQIPAQTFKDEDGDTRSLKLELQPLNVTFNEWLMLDKPSQKLFGLPLRAGEFPYSLTAIDSSNNQKADAFDIAVKPNVESHDGKFNHEFVMNLSLTSETFANNVQQQVTFLRRLASALGDRNVAHVTVLSIQSGSVIIRWANNTLSTKHCSKQIIQETLSEMKTKIFRDRLLDEFPVNTVAVEYTGTCDSAKTLEPAVVPPSKTPGGVGSKTSETFVATILPAIIIVLLLLLAIIVACVLYKRNKKTKHASDESKSEFVSKGVPVIFSDEMDAEKESMAATPMLLKDEKPPLQPADFAHTNGNGNGHHHQHHHGSQPQHPSSLKSTFGKKPTTTNVEETELTARPLLQDFDENPLYRPPPPFEPSRIDSRSPRPKHASPQQREPPPYVPP